MRLDDDIKQKIRTLLQVRECSDYFHVVRMFITKHLRYKIDSDSKHIPIRAFGYEATKIERNMIMENKYFANLEYREVNGVLIPDIELRKRKKLADLVGNTKHG